MGFQPSGVKEFIKLDDTPAIYTGQAAKAAVVNSAEDALEFATMAKRDTPVLYLTTNLIFDGNNPLAWADLDTTIGGEGIVFLKVLGNPGADRKYHFKRKGDAGDEAWGGLNFCNISNVRRLAYICVPTDAAGFIQWYQQFEAANCQIWVIGYWLANFVDAVIATGVGTGAWVTIDTGVPSALVFLQVTSTEVAGNTLRTRLTGETLSASALFDAAKANFQDIAASYLMMLTNEDGEIDIYLGAGLNFTLSLVASINPSAITQVALFDETLISTAFIDMATPFGRGFAFLRWLGQNAALSYTQSRENGETRILSNTSSGCVQVANQVANQLSYNFVPLIDYTGIFEFAGAAADEWAIRTLAMCE